MILHRETLVLAPPDEVFAFFADPRNLALLTPGSFALEVVSAPHRIVTGARIEFRVRLFGLPLRWVGRIDEVEEGRRFVDVQERGPYRSWRHTHGFSTAPGGTLVTDHVEYDLPGPASLPGLARLIDRLLVRWQLDALFDHRERALLRRFSGGAASA